MLLCTLIAIQIMPNKTIALLLAHDLFVSLLFIVYLFVGLYCFVGCFVLIVAIRMMPIQLYMRQWFDTAFWLVIHQIFFFWLIRMEGIRDKVLLRLLGEP